MNLRSSLELHRGVAQSPADSRNTMPLSQFTCHDIHNASTAGHDGHSRRRAETGPRPPALRRSAMRCPLAACERRGSHRACRGEPRDVAGAPRRRRSRRRRASRFTLPRGANDHALRECAHPRPRRREAPAAAPSVFPTRSSDCAPSVRRPSRRVKARMLHKPQAGLRLSFEGAGRIRWIRDTSSGFVTRTERFSRHTTSWSIAFFTREWRSAFRPTRRSSMRT